MALIDHVRYVRLLAAFPLEEVNLMENPEDLIRINGTKGQVVVRITAIVKVKTAEHIFRQEPSHNLLDILRRVMMTSID